MPDGDTSARGRSPVVTDDCGDGGPLLHCKGDDVRDVPEHLGFLTDSTGMPYRASSTAVGQVFFVPFYFHKAATFCLLHLRSSATLQWSRRHFSKSPTARP